MNKSGQHNEKVWKALADVKRREILDQLAIQPMATGELVDHFSNQLCRTAVMKHLDVLVDANLVIVRREGKFRWNHLNPAPIQEVCDRWISRHVQKIATSFNQLKAIAESKEKDHQKKQQIAKRGSRKSRSPKN